MNSLKDFLANCENILTSVLNKTPADVTLDDIPHFGLGTRLINANASINQLLRWIDIYNRGGRDTNFLADEGVKLGALTRLTDNLIGNPIFLEVDFKIALGVVYCVANLASTVNRGAPVSPVETGFLVLLTHYSENQATAEDVISLIKREAEKRVQDYEASVDRQLREFKKEHEALAKMTNNFLVTGVDNLTRLAVNRLDTLQFSRGPPNLNTPALTSTGCGTWHRDRNAVLRVKKALLSEFYDGGEAEEDIPEVICGSGGCDFESDLRTAFSDRPHDSPVVVFTCKRHQFLLENDIFLDVRLTLAKRDQSGHVAHGNLVVNGRSQI